MMGISEKKITEASFFRRLRYKLKDIVNPTLDPKISLFSRLEKQAIFFVTLFFIVLFSVYLIIEFGYLIML